LGRGEHEEEPEHNGEECQKQRQQCSGERAVPWWEESKMEELHPESKVTKTKTLLSLSHTLTSCASGRMMR
jgi:hypothetical protein